MIGDSVSRAVEVLNKNELVALPTETVYGLAANGLSESAITKVFKCKNRPFFDPLILHLQNIADVENYITSWQADLKKLAQNFWPGPITILLPKKKIVPDLVTSGLPRAGFRVPSHPLMAQVLSKINFPVAAPSANPFGYISPTTAKHVDDQLGDKLEYILDGGECKHGLESTIVGTEADKVIIYRPGAIAQETIEDLLNKEVFVKSKNTNVDAPGMTNKHYAPNKSFVSKEHYKSTISRSQKTAVLNFSKKDEKYSDFDQFILSPDASLELAAANLFKMMRQLDALDYTHIIFEYVPNMGIGKAINDRLKRASYS